MDAKQSCLSKTSLKDVFVIKSDGEVLSTPVNKAVGNINLSTSVNVNVPNDVANSKNDFFVELTASLVGANDGSSSASDKKDLPPVFTMKSTLVGVFSVHKGLEISIEDIGENAGIFAVQLYPVLRQHITHVLLDMNISAMDAPWDIGLGQLGKPIELE